GRHALLAAPGDSLSADGVVTPGPHRAVPPCRHFPRCGGCQIQHVDDSAFIDFLDQRIVGALNSQNLPDPVLNPAVLSPPESRRRASLRAERAGKRMIIGFNEGRSHDIVDLTMCSILDPALFALIAPLRTLLLPLVRDKKAAGIRMTLVDQGVDLLLEKVKVEGLAAIMAINDFAQEHRLARLSVDEGDGPEPRWEPVPATVTLGGVAVPFPAGGFLQATAAGEAALLDRVRAIVGDAGEVIDLFSGIGTFALPLSNKARVLAVEGDRAAAMALKAGVGRAQRHVGVELRDLFRRPMEKKELDRFGAVVLDPPRAGAWEQMPALAACTATRIAYVSCNPATFARDAKILIDAGWVLGSITPVGQFRWSTHIELVAEFSR
ncbi:MAG: methyltransferase, partial [Rhizorhabdus sp.]|nr:methyltransferase [Rhizorhabdus sp.]